MTLDLRALQTFTRGEKLDGLSIVDNTGAAAGLRIWINGSLWNSTDQPGFLEKGENLIILTRLPETTAPGIELGDFLEPSSMDVTLHLGPLANKQPVFQLKRPCPGGSEVTPST